MRAYFLMSQAIRGKITHFNWTDRELRQSVLLLSTLLHLTSSTQRIMQSTMPSVSWHQTEPLHSPVFNNLKHSKISLVCLFLNHLNLDKNTIPSKKRSKLRKKKKEIDKMECRVCLYKHVNWTKKPLWNKKVYIPTHAIHKFESNMYMKLSELGQWMIKWCRVFFQIHLWLVISRTKEYIQNLADIPKIQLITVVFRLYSWTGVSMEWLTWSSGNMYHHFFKSTKQTDVKRASPVNVITNATESISSCYYKVELCWTRQWH